MRATVAVHVLVEVLQLEAVELIRDILDDLGLVLLDDFDTGGVPKPWSTPCSCLFEIMNGDLLTI